MSRGPDYERTAELLTRAVCLLALVLLVVIAVATVAEVAP
jgi:cbb3-type cytochrome oxidase cytochrome c subunit